MSKTIVINTDDLREFIKKYFSDTSVMTDFYCHCCRESHSIHFCDVENIGCTVGSENEVVEFFIEKKLANYIVPFS